MEMIITTFQVPETSTPKTVLHHTTTTTNQTNIATDTISPEAGVIQFPEIKISLEAGAIQSPENNPEVGETQSQGEKPTLIRPDHHSL